MGTGKQVDMNQMRNKFELLSFSAKESFVVSQDKSKAVLDLQFKPCPSQKKLGGFGIYFIEHKKCVVYIGKFQGTKVKLEGGNIFSIRWSRHLQSITGRGNKLSLGKRAFHKLSEDFPEIKRLKTDYSGETLHKDRGNQSSINRMRFALENLFELPPDQILNDITFQYVRFNSANFDNVHSGRLFVSSLEEHLLSLYQPQCNKQYKGDSSDICFENILSDIDEYFDSGGFSEIKAA
jgi:hypothetical protein